jgi:hypothetical protein
VSYRFKKLFLTWFVTPARHRDGSVTTLGVGFPAPSLMDSVSSCMLNIFIFISVSMLVADV